MSMIGNYVMLNQSDLAVLRSSPDSAMEYLDAAEDTPNDRFLSIDKAWHGIHYLLNGDPWEGEEPLVNVVIGGEPIDEVDYGYGPARVLKPDEVQTLASALQGIPESQLRSRYDPMALASEQIYPDIWTDDPKALDYLLSHYRELTAFFDRAANNGFAVVEYIG